MHDNNFFATKTFTCGTKTWRKTLATREPNLAALQPTAHVSVLLIIQYFNGMYTLSGSIICVAQSPPGTNSLVKGRERQPKAAFSQIKQGVKDTQRYCWLIMDASSSITLIKGNLLHTHCKNKCN